MSASLSNSLFVIVFSIFMIRPDPSMAQPNEFDWSSWQRLLESSVGDSKKDGIEFNGVDYESLRKNSKSVGGFDDILNRLEKFSPAGLFGKQKLAFWLNVYNLGAVKMILDHPGIESINDAVARPASVWKMGIIKVGGREYSLDEIENNIIRPMGDPRIHFAIVCASVSCPDLRKEPYRAGKLDTQLNNQVSKMLSNRGKGLAVVEAKRKIVLSKIFQWFSKDFGGKKGILEFIDGRVEKVYLPPDWKDWDIVYMDYNWELNEL